MEAGISIIVEQASVEVAGYRVESFAVITSIVDGNIYFKE